MIGWPWLVIVAIVALSVGACLGAGVMAVLVASGSAAEES